MLRNKLMTACSVAVLTAALYGCSSGSDGGADMQVQDMQDLQDQIAALEAALGEDQELTPEAITMLRDALAAAQTDLADAMIAHQAALDQAAMDAETAKTAALAAAAMDAETAKTAALAAAAMDAETAKTAALAAAAMDAETAKTAALAAAAMDAETAKTAALAAAAMDAETAKTTALAAAAMDADTAKTAALDQAAMEAETAKTAALDQAAMDAEAAKQAALDQAAMDAEAAKQAALDQAAMDAAEMAAADKTVALEAAAMEAETAKTAALEAAAMEAETAKMAALEAAAMEAETAKMAALDAAAMEAETAKTAALEAAAMEAEAAKTAALEAAAMEAETAKTAALEAAAMEAETAKMAALEAAAMEAETAKMAALDAAAMEAETAKTAALEAAAMEAEAAKTAALDAAKVEADAALKVVQDELAEAEKELAKVKEDNAEAIAAAGKADRIAREAKVRMAILTPGTDAENSLPNTPSGVDHVKASRNAAGTVTIDVNADDEDDDYAGGETTADSGDWNSVTLTKTDAVEEDTDTVVLYTDIAAPADVAFGTHYTNVTNFLATADDAKKARSGYFPTGATQSLVYSADSGNPPSFRGTFDDVPGVFTCSAPPCTLMTDSMGVLKMAQAGEAWNFTPDAPNDATVKVPDANYAYFGWWLNKPEKNADLHTVEVFADGTTDHEAEIGIAIEGSATYAGPAAGKYVTRTFTAGVHSDSAVGHFTAAAKLTARFDDDEMLGTGISGSVTSFVLDDTNSVPWKVTLETAMFTGGRATFAGKTDVDFGGGAADADVGDWQGSFYDAAPATPAGGAPGTVAGTFDAATDNASVIGGFGATKQ